MSVAGVISWRTGTRDAVDLRRGSSHGKEDPRQEELGVNIGGLDKEEQGKTDDSIAYHGHETNAQTVRDQAPKGTGNQGDYLVDEAESADDVSHAIMDAYEVGDNKRNAAVEEDEEGNGEQGDAEKIADGLEGSGGFGKGKVAHENIARHDRKLFAALLSFLSCRGIGGELLFTSGHSFTCAQQERKTTQRQNKPVMNGSKSHKCGK